jgi:hypothetical protein
MAVTAAVAEGGSGAAASGSGDPEAEMLLGRNDVSVRFLWTPDKASSVS